MFKKRLKVVSVPVEDYTDFRDRLDDNKYATRKQVAIATAIPSIAAVGIGTMVYNSFKDTYSSTVIPVSAPTIQPIVEPVVNQIPNAMMANFVPQQTGFIADKSLEMLATILDPVVQILVAISFPIASVIMIGACFFFMFGNSEKAWNMIMNAGLGYVLIQLSPLFLDILRVVGEAV